MNTLFLRSGRGGIAALAIGSLVLAAGPSRAADAVPSPAPRETAALGAQARRILEAWRSQDPQPATRKLRIVCWRTREREFPEGYRTRLKAILEHIRDFYGAEMERNGLGRATFALDYDGSGALVIHEAVGSGTYDDYTQKASGDAIRKDGWRVLRKAGLDPDRETIVLFTNLATWDPRALTFSHRSPYQGTGGPRGGLAWQLDHPALDVKNLVLREPVIRDREYGRISLGKHNSIFIGGIAHELGHALGLPHCRESADEARTTGTALMGSGNRTYGDELRGEGRGSFLTADSALRLASHPLFSGSVKGLDVRATARFSGLAVRAAGGGFVLSGAVTASPPVYAVLAYLDPEGGGDYDARTAVAVPGPDGSFSLRCNGLVAGRPAVLRLVACMANGATTTVPYEYAVSADGAPDVAAMEATFALEPFLTALAADPRQAAALRDAMPDGSRARRVATAVLDGRSGKVPSLAASSVPADVKSVPLSHLVPAQAQVGWERPAYDHLPRPEALLVSGGELLETGIYAHAPAVHRYDLSGGGWKRLAGKCGLPPQADDRGSVVFVIRADGKELFRSPTLKSGRTQAFDADVSGVRELELTTEDAGDGKNSDWGLWLGVELKR